jgi:hypothetical protein
MEPLTMIYLALLAAGMGAQYQGQRKVDKATANAMAEERMRRERIGRESEAASKATQDIFAKSTAREAERGEELGEKYKSERHDPTAAGGDAYRLLDIGAPTKSARTIDSARAHAGKSKEYTDTIAELRGRLGAFGNVMGESILGARRNAQDIGMNTTSLNNWNQYVLPAQLTAAGQAGRDWSTAGDVMKLAATVIAPWALGTNAAGTAGTAAQQEIAAATSGAGELAGKAVQFWPGGLPTAGTAGWEAAGLAAPSAMGIVADPRLQELLALKRLGHVLSPDDELFIREATRLGNAGMMH